MEANRVRRRLNEPIKPNVVPAQSVINAQQGLSPAQRANRNRSRSKGLLDVVTQLDTHLDPAARESIIRWVQEEYDNRNGGELLGLFGRCYLGSPYVDHTMDIRGSILEHFAPGDSVPPAYAPARALVRSPAYLFVEVYSDGQVVPVRDDGSSAI